MREIRTLLGTVFVAIAGLLAFVPFVRAAELTEQERFFQRCSLAAHVRITGQFMPFRDDAPLYFAEILHAGYGPRKGEVILLAGDDGHSDNRLKFEQGEEFILLAKLLDDGTYAAAQGPRGIWRLDASGKRVKSRGTDRFFTGTWPETTSETLDCLWNECRRGAFRIELRPDEEDLANWKPGKQLRMGITLQNTGELPLEIQNHIACETHSPGRREHARRVEDRGLEVTLHLMPIDDRHRLLESLLELRRSELVRIPAGCHCAAVYDLQDEYVVAAGGRVQVWATVGGRSSPPVELQLPEAREAVEQEAKLEELSPGPFELQPEDADKNPMPMVPQLDEAEIIDVVLSHWTAHWQQRDEKKDEVPPLRAVVLRRLNLPENYSPEVKGCVVVKSDVSLNRGDEVALATSRGRAEFHWEAIRIESIRMGGFTAEVEVSQNRRHNLGGSGTTYKLKKQRGRWIVAEEPAIWQS